MENLSLWIAFSGGIVSFFSPCILPLIPTYLANLTGVATLGSSSANYRFVLPHAISFVIGFSLIFILLGASLGLMGSVMPAYLNLARRIAGLVLIIFGLHLIGIWKVPFLYRERRLYPSSNKPPSYLRSFLIGIAFALGWTPCVTLVLSGILALAWSAQTIWQGLYLLAAYSLGLGIPILLIGIAFAPVSKYLQRLNRFLNIVSLLSGALLIIIGVLIFTNRLVWLNTVLT